jgi:Protein of unknown function (DUF4238)
MMSLATGDKLAQMLFDMRWSLSNAEHGFFITCDNPLVQWVDPESVHPIYGDGGFTNPTAQVTLALDPRTLLILSWDEASPERFVMTRDGVDARVACGGVPLLACGARRHRAAREAVQGLASKGNNGGSRTGKVCGSCDAAQVEAEERIQTAARGTTKTR